jgi:hypothetical protein
MYIYVYMYMIFIVTLEYFHFMTMQERKQYFFRTYSQQSLVVICYINLLQTII